MSIHFRKYLPSTLLFIFTTIVVLAFYAPMFAYEEGLQIFMFDRDFFADTVLRPGGFSDYAGCFLVQFFMYPIWTAAIISALVVGFQLVAMKFFSDCGVVSSMEMSVVCATGMMAALTSFGVMFGGCLALFLAMAALATVHSSRCKYLWIILLPVVYWITGGVGGLIFVFGMSIGHGLKKDAVLLPAGLLLLVVICLITKNLMQDDSLKACFTGVDYSRFAETTCPIWWLEVAIISLCVLCSAFQTRIHSKSVKIGICAVSLLALFLSMFVKYEKGSMLDFKFDRMVRYKQWEKIVQTTEKESNATYLSQCYLNLALNELGKLDSEMFRFVQFGSDGLYSSSVEAQDKCIVNSEIYFRLGLMNIAERLAIEAQEGCNTHQKSARQYKRLAEIAIINKNKPLADRYLQKLKSTVFYRAWANRAEQYINNPDHVKPLVDWTIKPVQLSDDIFFNSEDSEMFLLFFESNQENRKILNYYTCSLLLDKKIDVLYDFVIKYQPKWELGTHVYEAMLLYLSLNDKEQFNQIMKQQNSLTGQFRNFIAFISTGSANNTDVAKKRFGNTYWFYYNYCN